MDVRPKLIRSDEINIRLRMQRRIEIGVLCRENEALGPDIEMICSSERWDRRLETCSFECVFQFGEFVFCSVFGERAEPDCVAVFRDITVPVADEEGFVEFAAGVGFWCFLGVVEGA